MLAQCEGASLEDPFEIMTGNQKQIRHIVISQQHTFPEKEIIHMLITAARFNEMKRHVKLSRSAIKRRKD